MNPEDLVRLLDLLGERLGPTGHYVFGLAVRNAIITGVTAAAFAALGIVVGVAIYRHPVENDAEAEMTKLIGFLVALIGLFCTAIALPYLLNPEYKAIEGLLEGLR